MKWLEPQARHARRGHRRRRGGFETTLTKASKYCATMLITKPLKRVGSLVSQVARAERPGSSIAKIGKLYQPTKHGARSHTRSSGNSGAGAQRASYRTSVASPGVGASPLFGDIDPEPPGEIDQPGPMGVVEWDTGDSAPLNGVTLGVTGEEDAVDSWGAGRRANPVGQGGGLAREDIASRQMGRIEGQE